MAKWIKSTLFTCLLISTGQVLATDLSIKNFMNFSQGTASFNCAYKGKVASRKCIVSHSFAKSSIHPTTNAVYGKNEMLSVLTIKWPDGDVSRYLNLDSNEAINLGDNKTYRYKTLDSDEGSLDFRRGLIIQSTTSAEHVRLW